MSDDYHRPTLTFPSGAYNATQVRLYGLGAEIGLSVPGAPAPFGDTGMYVETAPGEPITDEQHVNALEVLKKYDSNKGRQDIINGNIPFPKIPIRVSYHFKIDLKNFGAAVLSTVGSTFMLGSSPEQKTSCGIIVGYAYEGHTYDLPKPKIMIIPAFPEPKIPADDSEFDAKEPEGYAVWLVDKLNECVELEMNQGFVEQIVLEANLPGKRSPTMYASKMTMGHRGGKLSD
ncbi:hypothetical protein NKH34_30850 [Mesorhizobium sp. M1148]|uniref:hypothetical protein n=1 Tax=unclassified Mesorhizobium TaxID=325217 RepID=UPI0012DC2D42|nr:MULTISPECIES: hypothetical protein [unclassified Mesorhizobium]WJI79836.1 hypothetical protein NLY34_23690 [Mesorhizobium sp. C374B]WJI86372.1 hypothetical protein NLY42_26085 [Mesorhizobium sp. C372A]